MRELLQTALDCSVEYLEGLEKRAVAPAPEAVANLAALDGRLPEQPSDPREVLRMLNDIGSPATMAMAGPRFFGFVIGGSLPVTLAANWLAGAWDQNAYSFTTSPISAQLEKTALGWMVDLFGLPQGSGGAFVTGATMANLCGLAAGRHVVLERAGWNVEADGLFGAPPVTVMVGGEVHVSVIKALGVLGFGRSRVLRVPVDEQGRMRADAFARALPQVSGPILVCLQAGNVNTGAFDPFSQIIPLARERGAWVHVDGAFGLWGAAASRPLAPLDAAAAVRGSQSFPTETGVLPRTSPSLAEHTRGIAEADSWATDAHKWLNVPYDSGLAFVRDPHALRAAMAVTADYLPADDPYRNPADYTPELSRRSRGVEVWAALRALGRESIIELVERNCRHARRFASGLREAGYTVLNDVVLNQVLVSFGDAETTRRVIAGIQADGTCWCGGTVWQGHTAMRISVSSWATTDEDVEKSLAAMIRAAKNA